MGPSSIFLCSPGLNVLVCPHAGGMGPSVVADPTDVVALMGRAGVLGHLAVESVSLGLVLACWWACKLPELDRIRKGFQKCSCQHLCPHDRISSQRWVLPLTVSPEDVPVLSLPVCEVLQDQQVGQTHRSFQITASVSESVKFVFPKVLWLLPYSSPGGLKARCSGGSSFWQDTGFGACEFRPQSMGRMSIIVTSS